MKPRRSSSMAKVSKPSFFVAGIRPVATKQASTSKTSTTSLVLASVSSIVTGEPGVIFVAKTPL